MTTPIDGFRKNLESTLPGLLAECEAKVAAAEDALSEQRDALAYIRGLAAQHGLMVKTKTAPGGSPDTAGSIATDVEGATSRSKE